MAHAISRIYATKADADAAIEDLQKGGFKPEEIFVVEPPAGQLAAFSSDRRAVVNQIADAIAKACIVKREAAVYAEHVAKGGVFVTVHAPFGVGRKATNLLDDHDPVDAGVEAPAHPRARYDEATPLSSTLRLPLLSSNPTPCGAVLGLPSVLSADAFRSVTVFHAPAPLSNLLGLPVMAANGETTSAMLRLPTVTTTGAPTSSSLGIPCVTAKGRPTSSSLGLPTVTARGRPTSSVLGLPTVTARGRPTSLGLPLLW